MRVSLTLNQLLAQRRVLGGLEGRYTEPSVDRTDGVDVDRILAFHLRQWYLKLLDTAEPRFLAPDNLAAACVLSPSPGPAGGVFIDLPAACRRAFSVKLSGWLCPAEIISHENLPTVLSCQLNPFTAATPGRPIAVMTSGAGSRFPAQLIVWPADGYGTGAPRIESLTGVTDPGEGLFVLDDSALASMPLTDILMNI